MARNRIQDGKILRLAVASTVKANDPVFSGNGNHGVALTDYDAADGKATVETEGVFDLSVQAADDAGNSAVSVGDRLYYGGIASPWLSKKRSGKLFGIAQEAIAEGLTATIEVKIVQEADPVRAAGVHTVSDSPLDTDEFIPVTGCLDSDIVLAGMAVNGGSPKVHIVSAVASASPAGITVTADGVFTAGDKIQYAVLREAL